MEPGVAYQRSSSGAASLYESVAQTLNPGTARSTNRPGTPSQPSQPLPADKFTAPPHVQSSHGTDASDDGALVVKGLRLRRCWVLTGIVGGLILAIAIFAHILTDLYQLINDEDGLPLFPSSPAPIPCHSHNDYWRERPVFSALETGCMGIEADVWLRGDRLWVAHTWEELPGPDRLDRTFSRLYIDRLVTVLEKQNQFNGTKGTWTSHGVYDSAPDQTLVLLVDVKGDPDTMWTVFMQELEPLRERGWLSFVESGGLQYGPITVVGTGNTDFDLLMRNTTRRDVFFDAPLGCLEGSAFDATNSYFASASFSKELGISFFGFLFPPQVAKIRKQVKEAHDRGVKVRYWNEPRWLPWVNKQGWTELANLNVDFLNVDYLCRFRKWWMRRTKAVLA